MLEDRDLIWKGMNEVQRMTRILRKFGGKANDIIMEAVDAEEFGLTWSIGKGIEYAKWVD